MPRAYPLVGNFNGGEVSPLMSARPDVVRVANGLARMEGFGALPQGAADRRPGFLDRSSTKTPDDRAWLLKFSLGTGSNFILEMGNFYFRFFTNSSRLLDDSGVAAYETSHPYPVEDLTTEDGTFALSYHQEGDVMYFAGGVNTYPQTLTRYDTLDWGSAEFDNTDGPWHDLNGTDTTVQASGTGGRVTLTSSAPIFLAEHAGAPFRLFADTFAGIIAWNQQQNVSGGGKRRLSDGKVYTSLAGGTTGTEKPVHTEGVQSDGGVEWQYLHSGFGTLKIVAVNNATHARADVLDTLPDECVSRASARWQFAAWSDAYGYPTCVGVVYGRLAWGQGRTVHFSAPDDFPNYGDRLAGRLTAAGAFSISIKAAVNIRWIASAGEPIVGTDLGEYAIRKLTQTQPFASDNAEFVPLTTYGVRQIAPVQAHGRNLFVTREGRRLIEQGPQVGGDGNPTVGASDRSIMAEHVLRPRITSLAYQATPWSILWAARADGALCGFSYQPEHEVYAWHRHPTPRFTVECVEGLPDIDQDQVWALVRVHGKQRVAQLAPWRMLGDDRADACFVDLCQSYEGPPVTTLTDLAHLEGETVAVVVDGVVHPPQVVSGGAITLTLSDATMAKASVKIFAGLPVRSLIDKRNVEAGAAGGTAQTMTKRSDAVAFRLAESGNVRVGPDEDHLELLDRRPGRTPFGEPAPLLDGDYELRPWPGDYGRAEPYVLSCEDPLPCTLLAIVPRLDVSG